MKIDNYKTIRMNFMTKTTAIKFVIIGAICGQSFKKICVNQCKSMAKTINIKLTLHPFHPSYICKK